MEIMVTYDNKVLNVQMEKLGSRDLRGKKGMFKTILLYNLREYFVVSECSLAASLSTDALYPLIHLRKEGLRERLALVKCISNSERKMQVQFILITFFKSLTSTC